MTEEEIMAKATPAGGWTRKQLAEWGVPWPPPKGWKKALIAGVTVGELPKEEELAPNADVLLRKLALAVVDAGHADILYSMPDVLAHFGAHLPENWRDLRYRIVFSTDKPGAPF